MEVYFTAEFRFFLNWKYAWLAIVRVDVKWDLIQLHVCHHSLHATLSFILLTFKLQRDLEKKYFENHVAPKRKKHL